MQTTDKLDIGQTGYGLLIEYTKVEIVRVKEIIKHAQLMEAALITSLNSLEKFDIGSFTLGSKTSNTELDDKIQSLKEPGYPYKGSKDDKVEFLLRKFNTASRIAELSDEILRIEGVTDGRVVSKSLNYKMNQMVADGKLVAARWRNTKLVIYALPEFFSCLDKGNVILKEEHYPKHEAWANFREADRNFNKAQWMNFTKQSKE